MDGMAGFLRIQLTDEMGTPRFFDVPDEWEEQERYRRIGQWFVGIGIPVNEYGRVWTVRLQKPS